ncbi:MAG: DUF2971 domain-containing protein [Eubacterium coprostanoligenes]|nr:DUF2971 domain-containing protein [Eubacterium coprostanoligenes]
MIKWATLYKYIKLNYVVDILDNHRLYLSDGKDFNDPFEITITNKVNGNISHIEGLHILSLTNSYRKKLMWSYYADSHKGVCLTVKVPQELVYPVCYSTKRIYEDSNIDDIISLSQKSIKKNVNNDFSRLNKNKKIAYIKDKKWYDEKEYRVVFDKDDENGLIFEDDKWYMSVKITSIFLGVNFDKNDKKTKMNIIEACKRNNITIKKMTLSKKDYSINIKK